MLVYFTVLYDTVRFVLRFLLVVFLFLVDLFKRKHKPPFFLSVACARRTVSVHVAAQRWVELIDRVDLGESVYIGPVPSY